MPTTPVSLSLSMETAHFRLEYTAQDADKMDAYAAALEANHPRITRDLGQPNLPRITGRFFPDRASYTAATGWDATGSVDGPTMFSVVASPLQLSLPVHEFVHNVALHLNPDAYQTVWLWEATAVFEAGLYAGFVAASLNILIYLTIIWIGGYDSEMVVFLSILVASLLPNLLAAVAYYSLLRITTKARSLFTIGVGIFLLVSILPHVGVGPPPSPALSLLPENFDFKHLAYMDD